MWRLSSKKEQEFLLMVTQLAKAGAAFGGADRPPA
jgi:hypothetical protein